VSAQIEKINKQNISAEEWELRVDLAACYRLFVQFGWTDLIFTHLSARVPGTTDQYLINPYGLLFHEITASNLIKVDFDGNVVAGDYPFNNAGHAIHSSILRARPDVNVALHSHTRAGIAVSCMKHGLLPLSQHANEILGMVCYHDYDRVTDNEAECEQLAQDIGSSWLMIMRNHGLLSVGRTVSEAFYFLYVLENSCKIQVDVLASGAEFILPDPTVVEYLNNDGMPGADGPSDGAKRSWTALIRMLDAKDDSFRT
jgi:ribulose-5-phosphate 4-epimerase/fuculose-1-phosphate aldolase